LRRVPAFWCVWVLAAMIAAASWGATAGAADTAAAASASPRVEARSADLLIVGLAHADRMTIHVSRLLDNAPVRDAQVLVVLRGAAHPTTAETDGSYTLQTKDLTLPGAATIEFQVTQAAVRQSLKGTLQIADGGGTSENKNSARQLWWWVLNFAVCFGFLWLYSRRRKTTAEE